ncbi:protein mab-21-like 4 [Carettochelys insculpta]|uniref:protein mab-21-like 4 n=1 Tax=Carettochelys insculpta TaxID=44489 RepID=UPI003EB76030
MAVKGSPWNSYLQVTLSREGQRMEHFQKAENILLTVLEKVANLDPRFIVDYSRNLEVFEFALCTSEDDVTVGVPLRIPANALLLQECSSEQGHLGTVTNGHLQRVGSCRLGVPKEGAGWESWTSEDVFRAVDSAECRGYIMPGKVLRLLKERIVAAIVHCRHQFLIKPGDVNAESLQGEGLQLSLLVSSGWKMIRFHIVPVVRREQDALKHNSGCREGGFPADSLQKATQEADFIPSSADHWRCSTHRPVMKLLHLAATLKGHRLDSLRLLDQVNSEDWKEEGRRGGLTFNHLKMVLLWAMELFSSHEDWEELEGSVYRLLVILLCCLATKNLPHFLHPEENLFRGEALDLSALYCNVEAFASSPEHFLKCHLSHTAQNHRPLDNGLKAWLQLPAQDGAYWSTAYFDVLLTKFQVYRIKDKQRLCALSNILSKAKKLLNDQSQASSQASALNP